MDGNVFMDLWEQASLPPEQIGHPLILGRSRSADVLKHMHLSRRALQTVVGTDPNAGLQMGWTQLRGEMIELLFDADDVWQGLRYGLLADAPTWQVEAVMTAQAGETQPEATAGDMPLRLRGRSLQQFATLPNFFGMNTWGDPLEPALNWQVRGREYDKWVGVSTVLAHGTLEAEFLLRINKPRYESRFEIDYCLSSLSVFTPACYGPTGHSADPA